MVVKALKKKLKQVLGASERQPVIEGPRVIVIHNHIFKNAGSTIDWALHNNFGKDFIDHRDNASMRNGASYLGPYLCENKHIKALSTHHWILPLPELPNTRLLKIMMFRDPIERVTSVYNFERKQAAGTTPGVDQARKLNLRDYILWRMTPQAGATIRNYHVRKTLPPRKARQEDISEQEMNMSKRFVESVEMLGLVERFDESMVLFEETLKSNYPGIDLSHIPQNIGQNVKESRQARIERLRVETGEDVFQLLLEKNQADIELYEWAEKEVASRIAKIPNFPEKLADFESRCNA